VSAVPINCVLQRTLMRKTHSLLEATGGLFPMQCLPERVSIPFPQDALEFHAEQVTGVEKAVYQTLVSIDALFEDFAGPPQRWDAEKLEQFRGVLYRQIKYSACIMDKTEAADDFQSREASLKVYFEALASTLREKNSSFCAWEIVRREVLRILEFILKHNTDIMYKSVY
ncbi:hypothetical protein DNTS_031526, partial [Danionella cerebrum]